MPCSLPEGKKAKDASYWDGLCGTTFVCLGDRGRVIAKYADMFKCQVGVGYFKDEISQEHGYELQVHICDEPAGKARLYFWWPFVFPYYVTRGQKSWAEGAPAT